MTRHYADAPFRELEDFHQRFSGLSGYNVPVSRIDDKGQPRPTHWLPAVDVCEDSNDYVLLVELSDINRDAYRVDAERGVLTVSGDRRIEHTENPTTQFHRVERSYGHFSRSFALPADADEKNLSTRFHEGVLRITIPKSTGAQLRSAQVQIEEGTGSPVVSPEGSDAGGEQSPGRT